MKCKIYVMFENDDFIWKSKISLNLIFDKLNLNSNLNLTEFHHCFKNYKS